MGAAVQIKKKHIIIAAIILLALLPVFIFLKTNNQNQSLTDEQNSTMIEQTALSGTNLQPGQNDPSGILNSIQGGQTDSSEIFTDIPPENFLNTDGDALVMNTPGNSNLLNNPGNTPGNSNLLNNPGNTPVNGNLLNNPGNISILNSNTESSNLLNNNQTNTNIVINPGNENDVSLFSQERADEIEVAVIAPFVPPPIPSNMGLIPPVPSNMGLLSGGSYYMGSPLLEEEREEDESLHNVAVKPFYIGKYEVTQREYEEVMKTNPSFFVGADFPVENVSWYDAIEYCNNLSLRDGLPPAYNIIIIGDVKLVSWNRNSPGYRLPTEEEWEYACRAGTVTPFYTGETITRRQANYFSDGPRKIGSFRPNSWGLYDMHGNVSEWCWDWYLEDYAVETYMDAAYMHLEGHRVFRGGSWFTLTMRLRSAFRDHYYPNYKSMTIGFRIARNPG